MADSAAQAWLGWESGETGRLVADAFRTAATPAAAHAWFSEAQTIDVTDQLSNVATPTLVLHRQGDRQMALEVSQGLADALPNGQLIQLPGSLPALFLEDARGDLALITSFLLTGRVLATVASSDPSVDGITSRELEVLRLIAKGDSNAEIARALSIAVHTVERHVSNVYRKIGARGRADATAYALRRGLV